jgi:hypothetical protein
LMSLRSFENRHDDQCTSEEGGDPLGPKNGRSMHFRRRNKRKALELARLLAALDAEARRERPWAPRRAFRISPGRV